MCKKGEKVNMQRRWEKRWQPIVVLNWLLWWYNNNNNNWAQRSSNRRFKEKFGSCTRKTLDIFTTKDGYTWNITHNTESTAVWSLKPDQWGSPLVQEKYQAEKACDKRHPYRIIIIIIIIIICMREFHGTSFRDKFLSLLEHHYLCGLHCNVVLPSMCTSSELSLPLWVCNQTFVSSCLLEVSPISSPLNLTVIKNNAS